MRNRRSKGRATRRGAAKRRPSRTPGRGDDKRRRAEGGLRRGRLQHKGDFAFLIDDAVQGKDVFIRGASLRLAFDGDRVEVRLKGLRRGRPEGEIIRVLEHSRTSMVGLLRPVNRGWKIVGESSGDALEVEVLGWRKGLKPVEGALAAVRITRWPGTERCAAGMVSEILGLPGTPGVRLKAVLRAREIAESFPPEVLKETSAFPDQLTAATRRGRRSLRDLPLLTIDGADAKDFDDAVSIERIAGGKFRLGVHIADVSAYVRPGSALDAEAYRRATSVYLPGRVVPMLPPKLSNHLCSLMPRVDRLALSCFMDIDAAGRVRRARFEDTVVRSRRRFTYKEVEDVLQGRRVPDVHPKIHKALKTMGALARLITRNRLGRGALDFDMPEFKVEVNRAGAPTGIIRSERLASHRLIEEFMILANEAAARSLLAARRSFPSRIHEDPDPDKLGELAAALQELGIAVPANLAASPGRGLQRILKLAEAHPLRDIIGIMVMRSLKQAVYSEKPKGHFGLASEAYCHFTSPIRRYPDLLTHRALRAVMAGRPGARGAEMMQACIHASLRERAAVDAERCAVSSLRAEYLSRRAGREFPGVVTRVTTAGAFVELPENGAVGLVRGGKLSLGARVRVVIESVNKAKGEIELGLRGRPVPAEMMRGASCGKQVSARRERRTSRRHGSCRGRGKGRKK